MNLLRKSVTTYQYLYFNEATDLVECKKLLTNDLEVRWNMPNLDFIITHRSYTEVGMLQKDNQN